MKNRFFLIVALLLAIVMISGCGRSASRLAGKDFRQELEVPAGSDVISISFDKNGGSTVKNVTYYVAAEGVWYTQEFKDVSPLEGIIRWVPHGQGSDLIQSRGLSRWTGDVVNLELPDDLATMVGVDIGFSGKNERVKNVSYITKDGKFLVREYREGFIDRNFEGWLEVVIAE